MAFARSFSCCIFLLPLFYMSISEAKEFLVGGKSDAWKVPSSEADSLNKWAGANRFHIGDSLLWTFEGSKDSALQVSKEAYQSCNISNPIATLKGSESKVKLDRSGPFFFISGEQGNCEKGEKVIIVVMSSGRGGFFNASPVSSPAPSPAGVGVGGPTVGPTSGGSGMRSLKGGGFVVALVVLVGVVF